MSVAHPEDAEIRAVYAEYLDGVIGQLRDAGVRADWVRAGIVVYGSAPDYPENTAAHWGLQPTMTLATRVIGVQQLQP